ncbi:hypothetical protein JYU23_01900, partial [bacterium AH-315-C07]|nr:hypothetical protein [bacterium AH-315-C07]
IGGRYMILLLALAFALGAKAVDVSVSAKVDTADLLIGDQFTLTIETSFDREVKLGWPAVLDSLKGFELVKPSERVTEDRDGRTVQHQDYLLTIFDSGSFVVPAFLFKYIIPGDSNFYEASTSVIPITVSIVQADSAQVLRDIKGPIDIKLTLMDVMPYVIGATLLLFLVWLVYIYITQRKKGENIIVKTEPKIPDHQIALTALLELEEKRMWQNGNVKQYQSELTDIIREYIESRFKVPAMESTTDEIMESLRGVSINKDSTKSLNEMLVLADLAKFAKKEPLPSDHEKSLSDAYEFVKQNKEETFFMNGQEETDDVQVKQMDEGNTAT